MLLGVELVKRCGVGSFVLESDSSNAIKKLSPNVVDMMSPFGNLDTHFHREISGLQFVGFSSIVRSHNCVIDSLARYACNLSNPYFWLMTCSLIVFSLP